MIFDDVHAAQARNDRQHVQNLLHVLHHYLRQHPEARPDALRRSTPGAWLRRRIIRVRRTA